MTQFKQILDDGVRDRAFPGAVVLVGGAGEILIEETAGRFEYAPDSPVVQPGTIYDVASLTKVVVTTTLAMMLWEERKLKLDEQRDGYTIRELLTHCAGGTGYIYSDTGFITLGHIIEETAGQSLDVLAKERIFVPLGMADTCFNPPLSLLPRIAPTTPVTRGVVHDPIAARMGGVAGHAGLFSTARDLTRFASMMLKGGRAINLFTQRDGRIPESTRALGWDTPSEEGSSAGHHFSKTSFGHTGFTGTSIWIDPVRKLYVVFLTNRVFPDSDNLKIREIRPRLHDAIMLSLIPAGI